MMNILSIGSFDAAGVQTNFANCWNKYGYGSWRTYFVNNYMDLPVDIPVTVSFEEIKKIVDETDIFIVNVVIDKGEHIHHLINDWDTITINGINGVHLLFPYIIDSKKPVIFFINGSNNIRTWSPLYQRIFKGITNNLVVSTPDLLGFFPTANYFPGFIDINNNFWNLPTYKRKELWIGHFPTNPKIKNTREFLDNVSKLSNLDIKLDVVNGVAHAQSINYRRDMDLTFDHLGGYYGINSLESAALGIVNMVRLTDENKKIFCDVAGTTDTPWDLVNNVDDVNKLIKHYHDNREDLQKRKVEVKEWMIKNWSPKKHLDRMKRYFDGINTSTK